MQRCFRGFAPCRGDTVCCREVRSLSSAAVKTFLASCVVASLLERLVSKIHERKWSFVCLNVYATRLNS